jgi:hypothetical protein
MKVRDQFGEPVHDARVTYYYNGRTEALTDRKGDIHMPYYLGSHLYIADVKASGYRIDHLMASNVGTDDAIFPEITVPAWKIVQAPQLFTSRSNFEIETDGRPYYINLLRQEISPVPLAHTDLEVRVTAPLEPLPFLVHLDDPDRKPYSWTLDIRCLHGGLQPAPPGYRFLAPESGYKPSYIRTITTDGMGSGGKPESDFYLRLRDGKVFAVAEIGVTTFSQRQRHVFVDAKVNPAADRNLFWGNGGLFDSDDTRKWLDVLYGGDY